MPPPAGPPPARASMTPGRIWSSAASSGSAAAGRVVRACGKTPPCGGNGPGQPVGQRHVAVRARAAVLGEQSASARCHRRADGLAREQGLVELGHELGRRDRVHAVGHGHYRRAARRAAARSRPRLPVPCRPRPTGRRSAPPPALRPASAHPQPSTPRPDRPPPPSGSRTPAPPRPSCAIIAGRTPGRRCPARRPAAPVAVEMHHVERRRPRRRPRRTVSRSAAERRRAQHGQLDLAAHRVQPFQQRPGHHLIPTSSVPAGREITISTRSRPPGISNVPAPPSTRRLRDTPPATQRHRSSFVAHQLPRQRQHSRHSRPEHHLGAPPAAGRRPVLAWSRTPTRTPAWPHPASCSALPDPVSSHTANGVSR